MQTKAEDKHAKLNAIAEFFVAINMSLTLINNINVRIKRTTCSISSVNPQLK